MFIAQHSFLKRLQRFLSKKRTYCFALVAVAILMLFPVTTQAKLQTNELQDGTKYIRSLESVRDLDYQTWQLVVYPKDSFDENLTLRIVGYPGTLRFDHPTYLKVHSGRRDWNLEDITLVNKKLVNDPRQAAAEFDITPLLLELENNRPLRLMLPGVLSELPVPPYLVSEWRSLIKPELSS